ncbi:PR-1-like protein [Aspergillus campestris IBT 28561]|uniref:PR-1-like protein n=1 Tax=Aspergillus campestris (strain IBT 28561) TaxID=1392248 RepID=A0A2I1D4A4_ASPC2|nr:PR-1-like protein [Aspergillus campestris IBT 28561]PKY04712.1 PR-1-like protein [Aspergillus campestris IBT 28561]
MTPTAPHPPSYTSPSIFRDTVLASTNDYRSSHNASALVWNETLTEYAADWAGGCKWEHSHGPHGENLAFGYPDPEAAIAAWADESHMYNYDTPTGFTEETGHFTQLVWRGTEQMGCAAIDCGFRDADSNNNDRKTRAQKESTLGKYEMAQGWYVVCEYSPAGNVVGSRGGSSSNTGGDSGGGSSGGRSKIAAGAADGSDVVVAAAGSSGGSGGGSGGGNDDKWFFRVNVQPSSTYSGPWPSSTADEGGDGDDDSRAGRVYGGKRLGWKGILAVVVVVVQML